MNQRLSSDGSLQQYQELNFPTSVEESRDSARFFSCCIVASTSLIFYGRKLLSADHFKKMNVCRILTRILDPKSPTSGRVISKLDGVSQALEKGFLKEFAILICDDRENTDSAAELYSWQFVYNSRGVPTAKFVNAEGECIASVTYNGVPQMKEQLKLLLVKLRNLFRNVLRPLATHCFAGLRVSYTESRPDSYCVPGFEPSERMYVLKEDARPVPFRDGGMASPHHGMLLSVSSSFLPRSGDETIYEKIAPRKLLDRKLSDASFDQSMEVSNVFSSANNSVAAPDTVPVTAPVSVRKTLNFSSSNESLLEAELEIPRVTVRSDSELALQRQTKDLIDDRLPKAKNTASRSNTNTVTSAAAPEVDDFFDESSLILDRRTRSSMSIESSDSSSASVRRTNPPKRKNLPVATKISMEKHERAKSRAAPKWKRRTVPSASLEPLFPPQ